MSEFVLDTSGAVHGVIASDGDLCANLWSDLSPFTQGYIEALFAGVVDGSTRLTGNLDLIPDEWAFRHLAPETLARIIADCEAFAAGGLNDGAAYDVGTGRQFWEARQKGLWVTIDLPPLTVQLGDDGKVRFARATGADQ